MKVWKVILATVLIFGTGAASGYFLSRHFFGPTEARSRDITVETNSPPMWRLQHVEFLKRIEKPLNLTPEQRVRLEAIMRSSHERTKPIWDEIGPQLRAELKQVREQILTELNPEQQQKFESLLKTRSFKHNEPPSLTERPPRRRPGQTNSPANRPPPRL